MRGTIGLLLYVAVMVLGSILKKMAEDKAKQVRTALPDEGDSYTVTLDDMLAGEVPADEQMEDFAVVEAVNDFDLTTEHDADIRQEPMENLDDWEDRVWEKPGDDDELITDLGEAPQHLSWAQAIVLSEIIREPRAKRAWPNR